MSVSDEILGCQCVQFAWFGRFVDLGAEPLWAIFVAVVWRFCSVLSERVCVHLKETVIAWSDQNGQETRHGFRMAQGVRTALTFSADLSGRKISVIFLAEGRGISRGTPSLWLVTPPPPRGVACDGRQRPLRC